MMGRAPCCDKANVKKGPWSPEEDDLLKRYVETHGSGGNWISLPQKAGLKRCGKSCRLRWLNYLRPNIKHGGFSEQEDGIICSLYSQMGSRWSLIASHLPGRTDNDVKNHWNTKLKKKLLAGKLSLTTSKTINDQFPLFSYYVPNHPENYHHPSASQSQICPTTTSPISDQYYEFADTVLSDISGSYGLALDDKKSALPNGNDGSEDAGVLMDQGFGLSGFDLADITSEAADSDGGFPCLDDPAYVGVGIGIANAEENEW